MTVQWAVYPHRREPFEANGGVLLRCERNEPRGGSVSSATNGVLQVAIAFENGIYSLPRPARHCDIFALYLQLNPKEQRITNQPHVQGFLGMQGRFLNRTEAYVLAEANNQFVPDYFYRGPELFSEDVW